MKEKEYCTCITGSLPIPKKVIDICTRCGKKTKSVDNSNID
jgi:hypothetical protein